MDRYLEVRDQEPEFPTPIHNGKDERDWRQKLMTCFRWTHFEYFFWKLCFQFCQSRRNEFMARSRSSFLMIFFSIDKQFWQDEIFLFMWRQIWSAKPKIIIFCHTWTKNFFSQEYCCAQNCWHLTTKAKLFFSISVLFFVGPLFLKKPVSQLRRIMHKCDSTKHCRRC